MPDARVYMFIEDIVVLVNKAFTNILLKLDQLLWCEQ